MQAGTPCQAPRTFCLTDVHGHFGKLNRIRIILAWFEATAVSSSCVFAQLALSMDYAK